jgi:CRISPR-associated protein Cas2
VFECSRLSEEKFLKMCRRIDDVIDHTADSVRYYSLCKTCVKNVEFSGVGEGPDDAAFRVIG